MVLEGFDRKWFYLNDPATGHRRLSAKEFEAGFTGVALKVKPAPSFEPGGAPSGLLRRVPEWLAGAWGALAWAIVCGLMLAVLALAAPLGRQPLRRRRRRGRGAVGACPGRGARGRGGRGVRAWLAQAADPATAGGPHLHRLRQPLRDPAPAAADGLLQPSAGGRTDRAHPVDRLDCNRPGGAPSRGADRRRHEPGLPGRHAGVRPRAGTRDAWPRAAQRPPPDPGRAFAIRPGERPASRTGSAGRGLRGHAAPGREPAHDRRRGPHVRPLGRPSGTRAGGAARLRRAGRPHQRRARPAGDSGQRGGSGAGRAEGGVRGMVAGRAAGLPPAGDDVPGAPSGASPSSPTSARRS